MAFLMRGSPQRIFATRFASSRTSMGNRRPPHRHPRRTFQVQNKTKAVAVPSDYGVRFDADRQSLQTAHGHAVPTGVHRRRQFGGASRSAENAKCQVLQSDRGSRFEGGRHGRSQRVMRVARRAEKMRKDSKP